MLQISRGRARPRIHWCATGPFAFVPVHAAGVYEGPKQECCSDYAVSSYTPTLTALIQARKGESKFVPEKMNVMIVAVEHAKDPIMPPLRWAMAEARDVANIATQVGASSSVLGDPATTAEVLATFQRSDVVHIACHGVQHKREPHKSHFCLGTGDLSVSELTKLNLKKAFLAYLSACETAKGDEKHADEAVHLAATMLFAGFKSVVATMW
jgi:CHAT domain-containing protein